MTTEPHEVPVRNFPGRIDIEAVFKDVPQIEAISDLLADGTRLLWIDVKDPSPEEMQRIGEAVYGQQGASPDGASADGIGGEPGSGNAEDSTVEGEFREV